MIKIILSALISIAFVHALYNETNEPAAVVVSIFFIPLLSLISYTLLHIIGIGLGRIYRLIAGLNDWYQSFKKEDDDYIISAVLVTIIVTIYWASK